MKKYFGLVVFIFISINGYAQSYSDYFGLSVKDIINKFGCPEKIEVLEKQNIKVGSAPYYFSETTIKQVAYDLEVIYSDFSFEFSRVEEYNDTAKVLNDYKEYTVTGINTINPEHEMFFPEGIKVGDSFTKLIEVFGSPDKFEKEQITYIKIIVDEKEADYHSDDRYFLAKEIENIEFFMNDLVIEKIHISKHRKIEYDSSFRK